MIQKVFYLVVISLLLGAPKAEAYLDPGTSTMIIQVIVAIFVAGGVFWRSILSFFKKIFKIFKKK
jgi:predicted cobalt transporter CbtA